MLYSTVLQREERDDRIYDRRQEARVSDMPMPDVEQLTLRLDPHRKFGQSLSRLE
jgi:hypothetical protein